MIVVNQPYEPVECLPAAARPAARHRTRALEVRWGRRSVRIGGGAPVVVQSMTNTDTADAIATAVQVKELAQAGSEIVRITVNSPEAAAEVASIRSTDSKASTTSKKTHGRKKSSISSGLKKLGQLGGGKRRTDSVTSTDSKH